MPTSRTFITHEGEMLWRCRQCNTGGLKAHSQRRCPNCGEPQDPRTRYFPKKGESVDLGTRTAGPVPDWVCSFCGTANPRSSSQCESCGAERDKDAKDVRRVPSRPSGAAPEEILPTSAQARQTVREAKDRLQDPLGFGREPDLFAAEPVESPRLSWTESRNLWGGVPPQTLLLVVGAVAFFSFLIVAMTCSKEETLTVEAVHWERSIEREEMKAVPDADWCSHMPGDAYGVFQTIKVHHYNHVQVGTSCHATPAIPPKCSTTCNDVDLGNGKFQTRRTETCTDPVPAGQECIPQYREDPVYEPWCTYTVNRWREIGWTPLTGSDLNPRWPEVQVSNCNKLGCTRKGDTSEVYQTLFRDEDGKLHTCNYPLAKWQTFPLKSSWRGDIGSVFGGLSCDKVRR